MDDKIFQQKLNDLLSEIESMPAAERTKLEALAAETKERHEQLKKTFGSLHDSVDYLRLSVKYLMFDLEATRRENAQLRKIVEDNPGS